jgi:hypothetical protein
MLTAADAKLVEEQFRARLSAFSAPDAAMCDASWRDLWMAAQIGTQLDLVEMTNRPHAGTPARA